MCSIRRASDLESKLHDGIFPLDDGRSFTKSPRYALSHTVHSSQGGGMFIKHCEQMPNSDCEHSYLTQIIKAYNSESYSISHCSWLRDSNWTIAESYKQPPEDTWTYQIFILTAKRRGSGRLASTCPVLRHCSQIRIGLKNSLTETVVTSQALLQQL